MCVIDAAQFQFNQERYKDLKRKRTMERFYRIREYAQRRWERTHNLRHSRRWYGIVESVERRSKSPPYFQE